MAPGPALLEPNDRRKSALAHRHEDGAKRLKIETDGPIAPTDGIKVVITSPSLAGAELSGAVKLQASQLSGDDFALDTSGATKVTLAGKVNRLLASLTGASKLNAETSPDRRRRNIRHWRGASRRHGLQFTPRGDHRSGQGELRRKSKNGREKDHGRGQDRAARLGAEAVLDAGARRSCAASNRCRSRSQSEASTMNPEPAFASFGPPISSSSC